MRFLNSMSALCAISLLQACASTPSVNTIDIAPATDENITLWYNKALPLVEEKLQVSLQNVPMRIHSKGEMYLTHEELLEDSVGKRFNPDFRRKVLKQQVEDSLDSIIALYDPDKKEIVVDRKNIQRHINRLTAKGSSTEQAALTVLFHELAHAADDVVYDLNALRESNPWKSLERSAVLEGHAQKVTEELCIEHNCEQAFADDEQYLRYLPALTGTAKLFPNSRGDNIALRYVQGATFLRALEEKENGPTLVDQALRDAPADTLTLFDADRFLDSKISNSSKALEAALADNNTQWMSGWISVPRATFTQSSYPRSSARRGGFVKTRSSNLLGSAMASYYYPTDKLIRPVTFKLLQAKSASAADAEAEYMLSDIRHNTSGMLGWSTSLRNIKTWQENSDINGVAVTTRNFSTELLESNEENSSQYWVSIINYGDFIAEVSSFRSKKYQLKNIDAALKILQSLASNQECHSTCIQAEHQQTQHADS